MRPLVFTVLVATSIGAMQAPASAPPPQTFRSGANLVEVDARVFKDGRFVTDLGPADFEVIEDGVRQKIESVILVGTPSAGGAPSAPLAPSAPAPSAPSA